MNLSSFSVNNILDFLKYKKSVIGISISSRSLLEIIEYDYEGNKINNYTNVEIQYNNFTRQIENTSEIEFYVKKALEELGISLNSKVYLSLPTVLMNHQTLPTMLDDDSIRVALSAEAEKNYIFKKYEPAIAYRVLSSNEQTNSSFLSYTALPAEQLHQIKDMLTAIGLNIVAIDTSYSSMIRGIIGAKKIPENLIEGSNWNIVLVTPNSYMIFVMIGDKLVDVLEEPLAIKSFAETEVYQIITTSIENNLSSYPSEHVVIVSESDDISAEVLSGNLALGTATTFIENNRYSRSPLIECGLNVLQSKAPLISLEAIGIALWEQLPVSIKFNFINVDTSAIDDVSTTVIIMGREIDSKTLQNIALGILVLITIISLSLYYISGAIQNMKNKQLQEIKDKVTEIESQVKAKPKEQGISLNEFVSKSFELNKNTLKSLDSISYEIPEQLWLEEFSIYSDLSFYAKGRAYRVDDILNYYDSLRKLGKFQNLKISSLTVSETPILTKEGDANKPVDEKTYEFIFGEKQTEEQTTEVKETAKTAKPKSRRIKFDDGTVDFNSEDQNANQDNNQSSSNNNNNTQQNTNNPPSSSSSGSDNNSSLPPPPADLPPAPAKGTN